MMALRSMQKAKKTCTKCHWPKHSPTLYQLQLNKKQPPSSIPTKGSINMRGGKDRRDLIQILAEKVFFHCNREKADSLYSLYVETAFRANQTHTQKGGRTLGLPSIGQGNHPPSKFSVQTLHFDSPCRRLPDIDLNFSPVGPAQKSVTHNWRRLWETC